MYSGMRKSNKRFCLALITTSRLTGLYYLISTLIQQNNTRFLCIVIDSSDKPEDKSICPKRFSDRQVLINFHKHSVKPMVFKSSKTA